MIIGVGRDSRVSGPALADAVMDGMLSAGAKVCDCGMATTPAMFMSIVFDQTKFDGSAMITASHLPFNRNGIKFFNADGGLEHEDITEVLKLASLLNPQRVNHNVPSFDLLNVYAEYLKDKIQCALKGVTRNASIELLKNKLKLELIMKFKNIFKFQNEDGILIINKDNEIITKY